MGKHKKEQPEKWDGMVDLVFLLILFWLAAIDIILFLILFWPTAIVYTIVKSNNRNTK